MNYEKACGCIVFDNNKVLLIKHNKGHWSFPKGHVEGNETEEQTAIRETKEETNIDVEVDLKHRYTVEYSPKEGTLKEVVYFIAKKKTDLLIPQESEINQVKWVELDKAMDVITYDNDKNLFKKVLEENMYNK